MVKSVGINKYDSYLFLLIVSLAFGAIGGALQMSRLLSLVLFPVFIKKYILFKNQIKRQISIIVIFLIYSSFSLLWTPDPSSGLIDLVYFVIHFLFYFEIIVISICANRPIESISRGWLFAVLLTVIFAFWEFETGVHLPYCRNDADSLVNLGGGITIQKEFAAVAFVNYNTFVTFLCFALPFLFYIIAEGKDNNRWVYWLALLLVIAVTYCIFKNGSRGGFLSVLSITGIFFLMKPKDIKWTITIFLLFVFIIYVFNRYSEEFVYLISRVSDGNLVEGGERIVVWKYAWNRFLETFGFGVGIGGMGEAMKGAASDIKITHNIFLEILLLYGFVFFIVFIAFLLIILYKTRLVKDFPTKVTLYTALISFPIYGIINSGYLFNPFVYAGLASLYVFCNYDNFRPLYKDIR